MLAVRRGARRARAACDFCGGAEARWDHACAPFEVRLATRAGDGLLRHSGSWIACDVCNRLIERRDEDGLLARSIGPDDEPASAKFVATLQRSFFAHRRNIRAHALSARRARHGALEVLVQPR